MSTHNILSKPGGISEILYNHATGVYTLFFSHNTLGFVVLHRTLDILRDFYVGHTSVDTCIGRRSRFDIWGNA